MLVSHSQLATFRRCPREWHYRYQIGREPLAVSKALETGKSIHAALGAYHRGEEWELADPVQRAMLLGYIARWRESGYTIERTDVPFVFELEDGVEVNGEIDALAHDQNGAKLIMEHKTTSEDISPGSPYWRRVLMVDAQVSTYIRAARSLGYSHVVYDVLRKPALRQTHKENPEQFHARVLEDIGKRPEYYYQRAIVVRLENERDDYVRDVMGTVRLMQVGATPRNVDSCFKFGSECAFFSVCTGEVSIDDSARFRSRNSPRNQGSPAADGGVRGAGGGEIDAGGVDAEAARYRF